MDENGHRKVVRNGHMPARELVTGIGRVPIKQPRVDDRQLVKEGEERFSSAILPRYLKRVASVDSLIPVLYLKGVSTGDFSEEALKAILGEGAPGLSANSVVRLKAVWEQDYQEWARRDLSGKRYVYFWADGLHVNVRLDEERSCILVIMAADEHGNKELVAVSDGYRESAASWRQILLDLRRRGLVIGPRLATADGALGFWKALREVYPGTGEQICWFHKAGNVLDKMPKSVQSKGKAMVREMWQAPSLEEAKEAYDQFCEAWADKYPKGGRLPAQGRGVVVQLLRVSGGPLGASADQQPDRIHVRHGAVADQADEGLRFADSDPDDGVEVGVGGGEDLAPTDGLQADPAGDGGAGIRRRRADGGRCLGNGIRG